jgi:glutathione S-transferase
MDAALRHVAKVLLDGDGSACMRTSAAAQDGDGMLSGEAVIVALEYLRDRVGVPRDLPLPAARQLRAHLNWAIDCLSNTSTVL